MAAAVVEADMNSAVILEVIQVEEAISAVTHREEISDIPREAEEQFMNLEESMGDQAVMTSAVKHRQAGTNHRAVMDRRVVMTSGDTHPVAHLKALVEDTRSEDSLVAATAHRTLQA